MSASPIPLTERAVYISAIAAALDREPMTRDQLALSTGLDGRTVRLTMQWLLDRGFAKYTLRTTNRQVPIALTKPVSAINQAVNESIVRGRRARDPLGRWIGTADALVDAWPVRMPLREMAECD